MFIGLMSGTSLDGLDIALCYFEPEYQLLHSRCFEFPDDIKQRTLPFMSSQPQSIDELMILDRDLANFAAEAILIFLHDHRIDPKEVNAIGYHGQTLRHRPDEGCSLQVGNPHILAEMTGIDVIADFRRRDLAAGGEGAPLVPAFHHFLTEKMRRPFALLNLGGIANLSLFTANGEIQGFDTGPANTLIDQWIYKHKGVHFDSEGRWAATGAINHPLLNTLLDEPYFQRAAPKSTGRETFNLEWLNHKLTGFNQLAPEDIQATLTELSAVTIADALKQANLTNCQLILCGGGAKNGYLIERLKEHLPDFTTVSSDQLGWSADAMEAAAFAWLAWAFQNKKAGNIPAVTGAFGPRRLGALYPA